MDSHTHKMKRSWENNSELYTTCIGITGRRPVASEFTAVVDDLEKKFDVKSKNFDRILDVGCSNGYLMKTLQPKAKSIVGVDYCLKPLLRGKTVFPDMSSVQGEIKNLPFRKGTFDRILCYNMFHYLPSIAIGLQVTSELYQLLKTGGELVIGDIFTLEHKHLIPQSDRDKWSNPERPFMHRFENWLFMPIEKMKSTLELSGAQVKIFNQAGDIRCPGYRFDLWAKYPEKGSR